MKHRLLFIILAAMLPTLPALADGETQRLQSLANALHAQEKTDSAITVARCMQARAATQHDTTALVGAGSALGVYLRSQGKLEEALKSYDEALRLVVTPAFVRTTDAQACEAVATLYMNLATLHVDMQNKAQATNCARKSEAWAARCPDAPALAGIHMGTASVFLMCGEPEAAARGFSKAAVLAERADNYETALGARSYLAYVLRTTGQEEEAARCERRAEALLPHVESVTARAMYYQLRFVSEMNAGRYRQAIATGHEALALPGINGFPFIVYDFYNNMHEAWAELGDWHEAYLCLGKAVELKDSLFEADKAESLRSLTVKYQAKEKELALARSEADLAQTRMMLAMAALVVLAGALAVTLYVQRQRRRERERQAEFARLKADTDRRLTQRYIDGLEAERERLAKELHDGVCNDLYTVELLLANKLSADESTADELTADKSTADKQTSSQQTSGQVNSRQAGSRQADKIQADEANLLVCSSADSLSAKKMIMACREQVRRVSHELMPPEFKYADINIVLDDYIMRTAEAAGRDITYEADPADADWGAVADSAALEMYRITQEAVGNAVKHSDATLVSVSLSMTPQAITLTVADNGSPADFSGSGGFVYGHTVLGF